MTSYAAFLRGIGPGDERKSNESLRSIFNSLGFKNVRSFISSGNILFETSEKDLNLLEEKIEKALHEKIGSRTMTIVKSKEQLKEFIERIPFGNLIHSKSTYLTVTFIKNAQDKSDITVIEDEDPSITMFGFDKKLGAVNAAIDTTTANTPEFMTILQKKYGKEITTRTINTIKRVEAKL